MTTEKKTISVTWKSFQQCDWVEEEQKKVNQDQWIWFSHLQANLSTGFLYIPEKKAERKAETATKQCPDKELITLVYLRSSCVLILCWRERAYICMRLCWNRDCIAASWRRLKLAESIALFSWFLLHSVSLCGISMSGGFGTTVSEILAERMQL